jgi:hypothetical protein
MSDASKYNFPSAQKVQIFEQVDTYIENNYDNDPEIQSANRTQKFVVRTSTQESLDLDNRKSPSGH